MARTGHEKFYKETFLKLPLRLLPAIIFSALLLPQLAAAQMMAQPTPFSGDMQFSSTRGSGAGHDMDGKIYMGHDHMRMDMQGTGHGGAIMITNFAAKTTDTLMPEQHMYMEFKSDDAMAHRPGMAPSIKPFRDPSNPCASEDGMTCKNLGVEQVNGRTCDHWQMTDKNGKVSNVWIDQTIHFPIKSVSQDSTWQLTNIKEGEPSASLFEIPAGYHKMDMGSMMQGMRPGQQ
jgi:hypothetical protein